MQCRYPARELEDGDMITVCPSIIPTLTGTPDTEMTFKPIAYMSPWMFIPKYLEVNYKACSAVLLRSPLPQPSEMEIPSPYPPSWHQLVFEWYATIKRRKLKQGSKPPLVVNGQIVRLKAKFDRMLRRNKPN
jgi:hypothetical protein